MTSRWISVRTVVFGSLNLASPRTFCGTGAGERPRERSKTGIA